MISFSIVLKIFSLKELLNGQRILKTLARFFLCFSFEIRLIFRQSKASLVIYFFMTHWLFSMLENCSFEVSFSLREIRKMTKHI